jgi:hypothetical protein
VRLATYLTALEADYHMLIKDDRGLPTYIPSSHEQQKRLQGISQVGKPLSLARYEDESLESSCIYKASYPPKKPAVRECQSVTDVAFAESGVPGKASASGGFVTSDMTACAYTRRTLYFILANQPNASAGRTFTCALPHQPMRPTGVH